MNPLQHIARVALSGDALATRSLVQDWLASSPVFISVPKPAGTDQMEIALSAALVELFSDRLGQPPPAWSAEVGPAPEPTHLLRSTLTMHRLRKMCETESPLPLRRRHFYAPANYLEMI